MTTSHHIQTSVGLDERTPTRPGLLQELAVAALLIALVLGLAYGASWLLPLEIIAPRPR
jgi:predicted secreted protein